MSKSRLLWLTATHIATAIGGVALGIYVNDRPIKPVTPKFTMSPEESEWNTLRFSKNYDGMPSVIEVKLAIPTAVDPGASNFGQLSVTVLSHEPADLSAVEWSLNDAKRMVAPSLATAGAGGNAWGDLEIRKSDGTTVLCGLTTAGFALESLEVSSRNVFWSPQLADVVGRLYERKAGKQMPEQLLNGLKGTKASDEQAN